jgi:hypothetical protein
MSKTGVCPDFPQASTIDVAARKQHTTSIFPGRIMERGRHSPSNEEESVPIDPNLLSDDHARLVAGMIDHPGADPHAGCIDDDDVGGLEIKPGRINSLRVVQLNGNRELNPPVTEDFELTPLRRVGDRIDDDDLSRSSRP